MRALFSRPARIARYLEVEAALALAEADLGVIPREAGARIAQFARFDLLDDEKILAGQTATGHMMVPIVNELARIVGEPAGGWVHWGATTQNIQQTGDVLGLREAIEILERNLCDLLDRLAAQAERGADTLMAGRTHWQHAVPITFGFKMAVWADVMARHLQRIEQLRPRLLVCMMGGAAGTFASLGDVGPAVQAEVARTLALAPMAVPARNISDPFAEFVLVMALIAGGAGSLAEEVARLMGTDFGEVSEALPATDVGSSTMPQKRNAKGAMQVVTRAAEVRSFVPLALDAMMQSHEVDGAKTAMMDRATEQVCVLGGEMLVGLSNVIGGLQPFPGRMRDNLGRTRGLIGAEAIMLALGKVIGRQKAHDIVHRLAGDVALSPCGPDFADRLAAEPEVNRHLGRDAIVDLLDPARHVGASATIARDAAARARAVATEWRRGATQVRESRRMPAARGDR
ncbi:MAG: 3-carboxy-cis,cis-muconate cycloisomerase [Hyphomicrobiales bacterium]|nr:3-carboxy-cis,cis-muconate cycloisomerase [Hyphomicrobiales bacterium]